jgi:ferritin-like metal-binding protein YciE
MDQERRTFAQERTHPTDVESAGNGPHASAQAPAHRAGLARNPTTNGGFNMGFFSKDIKTLDDLFVHTLRDVYYAEKQVLANMPAMLAKATDPQLKAALSSHEGETRTQIARLERVFEMHGAPAKAVDCPAIDGILKEASELAGEVADKQVLDAGIIAAAQAVEHYEITRYGSLIAWANMLGRSDCAQVLQQTLDEEKATDRKLTALAEASVNRKAA